MQMNGTAPTQTQATSQQAPANDMLAMLAELRNLIQKPSEVGLHGNLTVGVSFGLLSYLLENRKDNAVATTFKTSFFSGKDYQFKTKDGAKSKEASALFVEELQRIVSEVSSALEVRVGLTYEEIQNLADQMLDGVDGIPMTYATFEVSLMGELEGRKRINKDAEGNEEEVFFLRAGSVKLIGKPTPANNPLSDDSSLASEEELKEGLVKAAQKSREGFNSWRDAQNAANANKPATSNAPAGPSIDSLIGNLPTVG